MELSAIDSIEAFLDKFGLMRGEYAIAKRFLFGGLLGAFVISYIKPSSMFQDGIPRPWSMLVSEEDSEIAPTSFPWFFGAILGSAFLGLFI